MFRIIFSKLSQSKHKASSFSHGYFYSTLPLKPISESFTSKKSAISVSKKVPVKVPSQTPDLVLNLLKTHGLTDSQIKSLITKRPLLLLANVDDSIKPSLELFKSMGISSSHIARMVSRYPRLLEGNPGALVEVFRAYGFSEEQIYEMTIRYPLLYARNADKSCPPKLEFFKSLGFSDVEIVKIMSCNPYILTMTLEKHIISRVESLMHIVGTRDNVLKVIKRCHSVFDYKMKKRLESNMSNLRRHDVPQELIVKIFIIGPRCLLSNPRQLNEVIGEVIKLGFDPTKMLFLLAVRAMITTSKVLWELKLEAYRSFGWSDSEINSAFKRQPMCMSLSVKKIKKMMGFFMNKLNMNPAILSQNPSILLLSLERRIFPRCCVLELLMSRKLIERVYSFSYAFQMPEKQFVENFVRKFQQLVPDVVEAYKGKRDFNGFHPMDLKM